MTGVIRFRVERFDKASHDRGAFCCGFPPIDRFFKSSLSDNLRDQLTACHVAVDEADDRVIGYFAFNAHSIAFDDYPGPGKLPRVPAVPAIYLKALAVDRSCQGQGLGRRLLVRALGIIAGIARDAGAHLIVLDALDQNDRLEHDPARRDRMVAFYQEAGFRLFPGHDKRMYVRTRDVLKTLGMS